MKNKRIQTNKYLHIILLCATLLFAFTVKAQSKASALIGKWKIFYYGDGCPGSYNMYFNLYANHLYQFAENRKVSNEGKWYIENETLHFDSLSTVFYIYNNNLWTAKTVDTTTTDWLYTPKLTKVSDKPDRIIKTPFVLSFPKKHH
jgi:hypothetical protein